MKRNPWLVAGICFVLVLGLLVGAVKWIVPGLLKDKIIVGISEGCPDCALHIKSLDVELLKPGRLVLHDVKFAGGQGGHSLVEARLEKLTIDVSLSKTRSSNLVFDDVVGEGLEIIYADGDAPKKPAAKTAPSSLKVGVYRAKFERALFRYAHTKNKRTSILHFKDLNGDIENAGNTADLVDKIAEAHVSGQIEKSGHGDLKIAALLRPGPWYVDTDLTLENQNLEDLNTFFTPNDGVSLKGQMLKARAKVTARGETAKAHIEAKYKDADFKQSPTSSTGPVEATLMNIGASLVMTKTNVDFAPTNREGEKEVKRDKDEPLVHFLLRAAKLGLLEVAKKKNSK